MSSIVNHTLDEIKRPKTKLFNPVSTMQRMNRKLAEIRRTDPADRMYGYLVNSYLEMLDLHHVNGRDGSRLEEDTDQPAQPTAAQVIAAANAAYDTVYAPRIPHMLAGTIADAAAAHQAFQAALGGGAA